MKNYCCGLSSESHDLCKKKTLKILQAEYFQKEIFFNCWKHYSVWTRENILPWNAGEISMYWAAGKHYRSNRNLLNWIFHGGWWLLLITVHVKLSLLTPDDLAYISTLECMKGLSSGINSSWKEAPRLQHERCLSGQIFPAFPGRKFFLQWDGLKGRSHCYFLQRCVGAIF